MNILYPAIFHKEDSGYWVEFPDLAGCYSQADTIPEIYFNAKEAMILYCDDIIEDGYALPEPSNIYFLTVPEKSFSSLVEAQIKGIQV